MRHHLHRLPILLLLLCISHEVQAVESDGAGFPLRAASFLFLTGLSVLAAYHLFPLVEQKHPNAKALRLAMMVGAMLAYCVLYFGRSIPTHLLSPDSPLLYVLVLLGLAVGWLLAFLEKMHPYGILLYVVLLTNLIAFSWLARLATVPYLDWIAFACILAYLARLSIGYAGSKGEA